MKKIGIIGAMKIEVDQLCAALDNPSHTDGGGIRLTEGLLHGRPVVLSQCDPGKVNAALCAQTMLLCARPDAVISLGVAGGVQGMEIGQAAVAYAVVQHDLDTTPLGDPAGLIPGLNLVEMPTDARLTDKLEKAAAQAEVRCCRALFATGDQFMTPGSIARVKKQFGAQVFEMEAGAIAQACLRTETPFAAVRVISDNGDAQAEYETFKFAAAKTSMQIVSALLRAGV